MMMHSVMKMGMWFLFLGFVVSFAAAAGPGSCMGRCGESFSRGLQCNCDADCELYNECCPDFHATCITALSCRGRCTELFQRGRPCECDPNCPRYNTCCHDYLQQCGAGQVGSSAPPRRRQQAGQRGKNGHMESDEVDGHNSNSESEERTADTNGGRHPCSHSTGAGGQTALDSGLTYPQMGRPSDHAPLTSSANPLQDVISDMLSSQLRGASGPAPSGGLKDARLILDQSEPSQGSNMDLCDDSSSYDITALLNGTILIFKGKLFWPVDPVSRSVGPPQNITGNLGVPFPVDAVFTRCNCEGKTYIIKGDQYWRLDSNMNLEPGFPQPLSSAFSGLTGDITAALPLPATRGRPETIYFFKKGNIMQKFSFPPDSSPSCTSKPKPKPKTSSKRRQSGARLGRGINVAASLKGFPTPVTSAVSMPSPRSDGYDHYVFSGPLFFRVTVSGDLPVMASAVTAVPASITLGPQSTTNMAPAHPANSIKALLQCV